MLELIAHVLEHSVEVILIVFIMMVAVDLLNVWSKGRMAPFIRGGVWRQYFLASFLGATPGCGGAFMNVSLYMHGLISFGALVGGMVATSGDEAFLMLAMFPKQALMLFGLLFVFGVASAWLTDKLIVRFSIRTSTDCQLHVHHEGHESIRHYVVHHIWGHIIRKHLWKTFLWVFGTMFVIDYVLHYWQIETIPAEYTVLVIGAAALIGLIPHSGPHIVFITMFANGMVPFSVLFTSAFVQDGHGLLPLFSYSVRDAVMVKAFNLLFGLTVGMALYLFGM